jgi:hypothetical protein
MAWEFLRRNPECVSWYDCVRQLAKQVLRDLSPQMKPTQQAKLSQAVDEALMLNLQSVHWIRKQLEMPNPDWQTDCRLDESLFCPIHSRARQKYWLSAALNPKCSSIPWITGGVVFVDPPTQPPPVTQMAADPYLERPDSIMVEINLHAADKSIWPQIRRLLRMMRDARGYVPKRERRTEHDFRELLTIYDEVQARLKANQPKFIGSGSSSTVRVKHAKYQAAESLVQGGYKSLAFGHSGVKT